MFIADLHIHSAYSRATAKSSQPPALDRVARQKGVQLVGSGDFTHPAYRALLREQLLPAEAGLYRLKPELAQPPAGLPAPAPPTRFIISGEISCIYKKNDRVRKVHNVILLPSLEAADRVAAALERLGNLHSDGRPILGLDSRDLLELTLNACPEAIFIPAHIWTPHFSLFGAYSGFDSVEECFGDLSGHIRAMETGLSSDPMMNFQLSALDKYTLVSNSDCHSPEKLGREANLFNCELSYPAIAQALADREGTGFGGTIEFFPEEGKYHFDGHRDCHVRTSPEETAAMGGVCPVCGRRLTAGVAGRVAQLADRPYGFVPPQARPWERLIPLAEVIAACMGLASSASARVKKVYDKLLWELGPELPLLREAPLEDIQRLAGPCLAEGINRLRQGRVSWQAGYDGEYGRCTILSQADIDRLTGQTALFAGLEAGAAPAMKSLASSPAALPDGEAGAAASVPSPAAAEATLPFGLSQEQWRAAASPTAQTAVTAGPGAGKTRTLVSRVAWLIGEKNVPPHCITVVTFTNKAAAELRQRLALHFGDSGVSSRLHVGTFHSLALAQLRRAGRELTLLDGAEAAALRDEARQEAGRGDWRPLYEQKLADLQATDFDGLLQAALELSLQPGADLSAFAHLLADEFQDADPLQYQLIRAWHRAGEGRTLFVIGDADQSIYGFRGADAACFDRLAADYPTLGSLKLRENYRSARRIVELSLPLMEADGQGRQLRAVRQDEGRVLRFDPDSPFKEAVFIAHEIDALIGGVDMLAAHSRRRKSAPAAADHSLSDIAVLARTHRQLELLESCLIKQGLPCIVAGRGDYLQDGAVLDCLAFFRFLQAPNDLTALRRCLRSFGCSTPNIVKLQQKYGGTAKKSVALLVKLMDKLQLEEGAGLRSLALALAPRTGRDRPLKLTEAYAAARFLDGAPAIEQLKQAAALYGSMAQLLAAVNHGQEIDLLRSAGGYHKEAVLLATLHGAKGLEFPVVFLAGLRQGLLPLALATDPARQQEERRLCYVGLTRAKDRLYLCCGRPASPFVNDLPPDLPENITGPAPAAFQGKLLSLF